MARIYANENFPLPVVKQLRELQHDVLTTLDAGKSDQAIADDEVLAFAVSQRRAILTLNRKHFVKLHLSNPDHFGIIVCTYDPDFEAQAVRIHDAIDSLDSLVGQLERFHHWRSAFGLLCCPAALSACIDG